MLKSYRKEWNEFKTEYETKLSDYEAQYVFERLVRHYHFSRQLIFRGYRQSGNQNPFSIRVSHSPSVGLLAHEVSHAIDKKRRIKVHTKHQRALMRRVCEFIMMRLEDYRQKIEKHEIEKRQRAETKAEKQKQEEIYKKSPEGRLEVLRAREKRVVTKLKRTETQLKKVRRRIKIWERKFFGG